MARAGATVHQADSPHRYLHQQDSTPSSSSIRRSRRQRRLLSDVTDNESCSLAIDPPEVGWASFPEHAADGLFRVLAEQGGQALGCARILNWHWFRLAAAHIRDLSPARDSTPMPISNLVMPQMRRAEVAVLTRLWQTSFPRLLHLSLKLPPERPGELSAALSSLPKGLKTLKLVSENPSQTLQIFCISAAAETLEEISLHGFTLVGLASILPANKTRLELDHCNLEHLDLLQCISNAAALLHLRIEVS